MKNPIIVPEIRDLLRRKKYKILQSFFDDHHAKEIAEYLEMLEPDEIGKVLALVDNFRRAEIFGYLEMDTQVRIISGDINKNIADLFRAMSHDDRADLFQVLEKSIADKLLLKLPPNERADVLHLTSYKEETAGAIMTTDYATLQENDTAEAAIKKIRKEAPSKETVYYIYVTNDAGRLIGLVSLRNLILSGPKQKVGNLMTKEVIYCFVDDDQEKAAMLIDEYDLIALPVVDANEKLAGIITHDDAIDIIREEQTEDLEKLMAISGGVEEKSYLDIPASTHFKKRVFWVIILGGLGLIEGLILQGFKHVLETLIILAFYLPLLNSSGGNTGSQSATVVLRAIALNELFPKDFFKVIKKEFIVSSMLCLCLGIVTFLRVYFLPSSKNIPPQFSLSSIAVVISLSLSIQVVWSTVFGAAIPMIATKLKIDPAVFSSPVLTTLVDIGGITIYFTIAKLILGI